MILTEITGAKNSPFPLAQKLAARSLSVRVESFLFTGRTGTCSEGILFTRVGDTSFAS